MSYKIAISAGELSGDEHAAELAKSILKFAPSTTIRGMGGRNMRAAGVETVIDSEESASVMGFIEVVKNLGIILDAYSQLKKLLSNWKPDLLIIIDYPDFNLWTARFAKKLGIPVLYYITPQVWAWRTSRAKLIDRVIERAAVIFPFEKEFFNQNGFKRAVYVGHPMSSHIRNERSKMEVKNELCEELKLDLGEPLIALLPGSRRHELERHLSPMIEGFDLLSKEHPEVNGVLSIAPTMNSEEVATKLPKNSKLRLYAGDSLKLLRAADAGIIKSGTSNLQSAYVDLPFSMLYIGSKVSEFIVKTFTKVKQFSIVNVVRPNTIRELLQEEASSENVANELSSILFDAERRSEIRDGLGEVREILSTHDKLPIFDECANPPERAAKLALDIIETT